jgi:hypothetical protein
MVGNFKLASVGYTIVKNNRKQAVPEILEGAWGRA